MEEINYETIASFEKDNWWYNSKRSLFSLILKKLRRRFSSSLDLGCGVGSNIEVLRKFSKKVVGVDYSSKALEYCKSKEYDSVFKMNAESLKFKENSFDLILCSDVLEHIDDLKAIAEIYRILKPKGIFIFSVPAHNYLWGPTDVISRHKKRYEEKELKNLIAGRFEMLKMSYWNFFMFFPNLIFLKLLSIAGRSKKPVNTLKFIPEYLNNLLIKILSMENKIFMGFGLPQGVSIMGVLRKK